MAFAVTLVALVVLAGLVGPTASSSHLAYRVPLSLSSSAGSAPGFNVGTVTLGSPGAYPSSVAFDPQTGNAYVVVAPSYIKVISNRTNTLVATVDARTALLDGPGTMTLDRANGYLLIATLSGMIVVFSPSNNTVVREVAVPGHTILYDPVTNRVLVSTGGGITILNATTLAQVSSTPMAHIAALAYDPTAGELDVVWYLPLATTYWYATALSERNYSLAWQRNLSELTGLGGPSEIAYDNADGDLYIPSGYPGVSASSDFVVVLNATTGATVATVPVGEWPGGVAYDGHTGIVFVANTHSNNVSAIQGTSLVFGSISVGGGPDGVASANGTGDVYVTNNGGDTVSVLRAATGSEVATVVLGNAPDAVAYDPRSGTIYAVGGQSAELVSDTNHTLLASTPVGASSQSVAYDARTGNLYVSDSDNNSVSVVSGATQRVVATVRVGASPDGVAFDNASGNIFVSCYDANSVYVISDTTNSVSTVVNLGSMGGYPTGVVYDPETDDVYVADYSAMSVISGSTWQVIATVSSFTSGPLGYPALDSANGNLYVPVYFQGIQVVSTASDSVVAHISVAVGGFPYAAAFDTATGEIFVTDSWGNNVSVLDGANNALVGNLTVGEYPTGVTYDNRTGEIYVANEYSDTLTYILPVPPPIPAPGIVFWVVLELTVSLGIAGVLVAVWIFRRSRVPQSRGPDESSQLGAPEPGLVDPRGTVRGRTSSAVGRLHVLRVSPL